MAQFQVTVWDATRSLTLGEVEIEASPKAPLGSVLQALPGAFPLARWFLGTLALDPAAPIDHSPLVSGCTLSLGAPGPALPWQLDGIAGTLTAVAGPHPGSAFALSPGRHVIARSREAEIALFGDAEVSRRAHALLRISPQGEAIVSDQGSANGTFIDGHRLTHETSLGPDQHLSIGNWVLQWSPHDRGRAAVRRDDGLVYFDRSFPRAERVRPLRLSLPTLEEQPRNLWMLALTVGLPMAAGVALALVMHQPMFLLMALLGPLSGIGQYVMDGRQRTGREARVASERAAAATAILHHVTRESHLRSLAAPGLAALEAAAGGVSQGLWPRNADHDDALVLRVGLADQPASIELDGERWSTMPSTTLPAAPVTVDLRQIGVLGVAGPSEEAAALTRWLIVQLATLRSPEDLDLRVISAGPGDELAWTRWLPHLHGDAGSGIPAQVGNTAETRLRRVSELKALVAERVKQAREYSGSRFTDVVVVLWGALSLRELPGMKEVLREGPAVGVYSICVDAGSLNEARGEVRFQPDGTLGVLTDRNAAVRPSQADACGLPQAEQIARLICPLRDRLTLASSAHSIPYPVRFMDLLGVSGSLTAQQVTDLWRRHDGASTRVVLGRDAEGPVFVDIAAQGPHTMLGGATGAGKSILLQTFVTSLLLSNSPDELNLVLVDFKGGSAFLPFAGCPHVVSLIRSTGETAADVFDQAAARRVLASVRTEVARREAILAPHGGEIDQYWTARRTAGGAAPPLPRLVLVFDEFARVLEVDQDFLKELVNVAAKGRSLGMHLVLATQSLQGKLSPELKNNITLRISLRQNEPADSTEVLDVPDAANIAGRLRGRGMILCTTDEVRVPRLFQSGYLGDGPPDQGPPPVTVRHLPWNAIGVPRPEHHLRASGRTDQDLAIAAIEAASRGHVAPFRPLLPPLPAALSLAALTQMIDADRLPQNTIPFGIVDEPELQSQPAAVLDLAGTDRVLVAGGPQSGRTTFARTLITSLVQRLRPDQVHLYVVERVPSGLAGYEPLPHCGAVIAASEPERLRRLVHWLAAEIDRRRVAQLTWSRQGGGAPAPPIVVIVDGWETFENRTDPGFVETSLLTTMREVIATGVTVGVHVVAIGGQQIAEGRLAEQYQQRLILPFARDEDRRGCVAQGATLPAVIAGRAIDSSTGHHVQISEPGIQAAPLIEVAARMATARPANGSDTDGCLPTPIPALPHEISLAQACAGLTDLAGRGDVVLGVGGSAVSAVPVHLFDEGPNLLLISGPDKSGRSTALHTVLTGLVHAQIPVLLITSPRSPLGRLRATEALEVMPGPAIEDSAVRDTVGRLGWTRYAVLVDDVHQLTVKPTMVDYVDIPNLLEEIADDPEGNRAVVIAGDGLGLISRRRRGVTPLVERAVEGGGHRLLLTPTRLQDAREHGIVLEADQLVGGPPGRGYLASGRTVIPIHVAVTDVGA